MHQPLMSEDNVCQLVSDPVVCLGLNNSNKVENVSFQNGAGLHCSKKPGHF